MEKTISYQNQAKPFSLVAQKRKRRVNSDSPWKTLLERHNVDQLSSSADSSSEINPFPGKKNVHMYP